MKQEYDHTCQICGERREKSEEQGYSEGHHIKPLGGKHEGPDIKSNILILCPNCHADMDYGMIKIDPETKKIKHKYDKKRNSKILSISEDDSVSKEYLEYHNKNILKSYN
ncbi:MAG: HNH endonuclease [Candidatus Nanohaloarchaea archaeon]